ncbi:rfaE bifunctional protein nucleotidyltransferase chain/domain [Chitinivorax tropicus]|uniref:D-glycero-beta-D-manno-heptose 1-phosphate adenylyltransferase n=1 Tax=Chitinivorax tropicus TaxID=714531 RepID=A0A840MIA2_9PROT|nr:D-glycero-beta-D-manno-heptose 1-phosphate adenylyltransferase [Chitinivorax tropicus]MBB5018130.1 rfaE bifunctional protein nucleotidyltransferase chain/domain [Chitinivorax tropicus]
MTYLPPEFENKICTLDTLPDRAAALPKPLVFTNGCFDILHRGHVTYLAQARALGAAMVVGVNTDASVKRLGKGDDRPINCTADRMAVLAALSCIDLVVAFDDDTPLQLILAARPDILVKGGDWSVDNIVGANEVKGWGGAVHSIPFLFERSTTSTLNKIRQTQR